MMLYQVLAPPFNFTFFIYSPFLANKSKPIAVTY